MGRGGNRGGGGGVAGVRARAREAAYDRAAAYTRELTPRSAPHPMRHPPVAVGLLAALAACTGDPPKLRDADPASVAAPATVARARSDTLGEVVPELSDSIWIVFQDADGAHWFGSDGQGVFRVEGRVITRFTTRDGLSHDQVRGIQQHAATGDLLISTNGGVSRYDGARFVTLPVTEVVALDDGWVLDSGDVWIQGRSGAKGPYRYDGTTLYSLQFPKSPRADEWYAKYPTAPWNPYEVWCVYRDHAGHMWFGTACLGICRFDGSTREWMYEAHHSELPNNALFGIRSILQDRRGDFWFCNTQYRYAMNPRGGEGGRPGEIAYTRKPGMDLSGTTIGEPFFYFMSITDDERGHLWMAPYAGGVWRYDGAGLTHYPMKDGAGRDITMFSIYRDRSGGLWVGTHEHGAYRFDGAGFERFRP